MKKILYSLMLSEEIIHEVDLLAHRMGTNRSNLVNRILAEHVQIRTPEERVNDIFYAVEEYMSSSPELVPIMVPNTLSMELRSCLEYKYRPTVRYEVVIQKTIPPEPGKLNRIGTLSIIYRTQSSALIEIMETFFRIWKNTEKNRLPINAEYSFESGKFTRALAYPTEKGKFAREISAKELAKILSDYIRLFDRLLKIYIAGNITAGDVSDEYHEFFNKREIII